VVWTSLLEESLNVVYRWPRLSLAAACGGRDTRHARAIRFLVVTTITVSCGCESLKPLLASLLSTPGAPMALWMMMSDDTPYR
jgi:hypothetical protein